MKKIIPIVALLFLLISCHQKNSQTKLPSTVLADSDQSSFRYSQESTENAHLPSEKIEKQNVTKKKIIKDGRMGIQVKELGNTKLRIDSLLAVYNGYFSSESLQKSSWSSTLNLKIRIPSIYFEVFVSALESGVDDILYKDISTRDVTDEFIDMETRLENKRNYLKRFNNILKQANSIREILEVEEKIRVLEEEIESTTGRLRYLNDLVEYSTLSLSITKPEDYKYEPDNRDNFLERFKQSFSKGWFGFVDFLLLVIKFWPFWIVVFVIIYFVRRYRKARRQKQQKS